VQGMYPNMNWSPDSSTIYFWANGQIHSVSIKDGDIEHIDFEVNDTRKVMVAPRPPLSLRASGSYFLKILNLAKSAT